MVEAHIGNNPFVASGLDDLTVQLGPSVGDHVWYVQVAQPPTGSFLDIAASRGDPVVVAQWGLIGHGYHGHPTHLVPGTHGEFHRVPGRALQSLAQAEIVPELVAVHGHDDIAVSHCHPGGTQR